MSAANNSNSQKKRNAYTRGLSKIGPNQSCEVFLKRAEVGVELIVEVGITAVVMGTVIEEPRAVLLKTILNIWQACQQIWQHKKHFFRSRPRHSCIMIYTQHIPYSKHKKIA
jgi:hypothetical protein